MTRVKELHEQWMEDLEYREEYEEMGLEFEIAQALIEARSKAGLTQSELAQRMGTTQSVVARMEGGQIMPSTKNLERFAKATGMKLKISFEPEMANAHKGY